MNRTFVVVLTVAVASGAPRSSPAQLPPLNVVMQHKAENAEHLLRPAVLGDFAGIDHYAGQLGRLAYTEIASWQGQPNSDYTRRANDFLEAIEALGRAANVRDAKGSAKAYAELISSCVNCHQLVGRKQSVALTPPAPVIHPRAPN
jgi:hypothetical protein